MTRTDDLARVDAALMRLRRMWDVPAGIQHEGAHLEGSTLLVCLAVDDTGDAAASIGSVAASLHVAHSTASRLVTRAVEAGMVRRQTSPHDPRRAALHLTDAGRRLVAASRTYRTAQLGDLLASWSATDVRDLAHLLDRFSHAVDALPPS